MQLLILAHAFDSGANAVAELMAPLLGSQLVLLRPEWLGQAQWSQCITERGRARTSIRGLGGYALDSSQISLIWNRTRLLCQANFMESTATDRDYAAAELQALVASFLAELEIRVVPRLRRHLSLNPPLHLFHWVTAATESGLRIDTQQVPSPSITVMVTPQELICPQASVLSPSLSLACHALADRLGFEFLELAFSGSEHMPQLCSVNTQPALTSNAEVHAVARWLLLACEQTASNQNHPASEADT